MSTHVKPDTTGDTQAKSHDQSVKRSQYQKPKLIRHGDVRDLTLGGTPGSGESGNPATKLP